MSSNQPSIETPAANIASDLETLLETLAKAASSGDLASYKLCAAEIFKSTPITTRPFHAIRDALETSIKAGHTAIAHDLFDRAVQSLTGIDLEIAIYISAKTAVKAKDLALMKRIVQVEFEANILLDVLEKLCLPHQTEFIQLIVRYAQAALKKVSDPCVKEDSANTAWLTLRGIMCRNVPAHEYDEWLRFTLMILPCYAEYFHAVTCPLRDKLHDGAMDAVFSRFGPLNDPRRFASTPPQLMFGTYSVEDCFSVLSLRGLSQIFLHELKE
ncbi:hypothetical protein BJY00DRAFT_310506 [Aspergillus carlsbadensis]|nr:hypothetical protein BJY00DRAFT_310506 [Aspergillus carlsbadensis]